MEQPKQLKGKGRTIMEQPNRGKGAGRKPKQVLKWQRDCNLNKDDARKILWQMLNEHTLAELDQLRKTEYDKISVLTFGFMQSAVNAAKQGDFAKIKEMADFARPDNLPVQNTGNTYFVDLKALVVNQANTAPEERERIIAKLEKITGNAQ